MSMWMMRSIAYEMTAERHAEAERARRANAHAASTKPVADAGIARLAGPIAAIASLALLLVSIPALSSAPATATQAPLGSPAPGAAPSSQR